MYINHVYVSYTVFILLTRKWLFCRRKKNIYFSLKRMLNIISITILSHSYDHFNHRSSVLNQALTVTKQTCPLCLPRQSDLLPPQCWQSSWSVRVCAPRGRTPWDWQGPSRISYSGRGALPWNCSSKSPKID